MANTFAAISFGTCAYRLVAALGVSVAVHLGLLWAYRGGSFLAEEFVQRRVPVAVELLSPVQEMHSASGRKTKPLRSARAGQTRNIETSGLAKEEAKTPFSVSYPDVLSQGSNRPPTYPALAVRQGWQGPVTLKLLLNLEGQVVEVGVEKSSGFRVLDEAARQAASDWQLSAELPARVLVTVEFELED